MSWSLQKIFLAERNSKLSGKQGSAFYSGELRWESKGEGPASRVMENILDD